MNNRLGLNKTLRLIFVTCFIFTLAACENDDDTVANAEILSAGDTTAKTIAKMPGFIENLALPDDGSLLAWITVDGGTRTQMQTDVSAGTSSATITGLSKTTHSVLIEFEFSDGTDTVLLAKVKDDVDLTNGNGSLSLADTDYTTTGSGFDDDNDGTSNLDEIKNSTNPNKSPIWGKPTLGSLGGLANHPSISLDGDNIVALWGEGSSGDANSSVITKFQTSLESIATGLTTKPHSPASTTTSTGNTIAVWVEKGNALSSLDTLCALTKVSGGGWQTTSQCNLDDGSGSVMFPQIVTNNLNGSAFAAYEQNNTIQGIFFNGNTWNTPNQISSSGRNLKIESNKNGTIIVVWREISNGNYMINATVWTDASAAWSTTKLVDADQSGVSLHPGKDAFDPAVSVNATGDVLVTWRQEDASNISEPWSNHYFATTGTWGNAQKIAVSQNDVFHIRPHLNDDGKYSAVYREYDPTTKIASLYLASGQSPVWATSTELVSTENKLSSPTIIGNGSNLHFTSWISDDINNNETFMTKKNIGTIWLAEERADDNTVGDIITDTNMVMDISTGIINAIWIQTNTMGSSSTILNTFKE